MLHHCATILLAEVNRYIQSKVKNIEDPPLSFAILGNAPVESKPSKCIIMRLVDIVSVELCSSPHEYVPQGDGFVVRKNPEAFSLYFLFSIDYKEVDLLKKLELLAYVAAFFQNKPYFDTYNTPILQQMGIEKFDIELVKLSASEKSMLWASLAIPYSPSLLYKVGFVYVEDATMGRQLVTAFSALEK